MSRFTEQFKRSFVIAKKNIKIYYSKGPVIIFGLIFPLFLALAYVIGRNIPLREVLPGIIGMTTFFTATSVGPSIVPWETRSKTLERLLCCPVAFWTIIVGDMLASFLFGLIISVIPLVIILVFNVGLLNFMVLLFGLVIANLCFSALSVLLSAYPPTDIPATSMMLSSLVKFPLVFISGVFIPIEQLPQWGRIIASFSPLTYFTDLARQLIVDKGYYPMMLDFLMIVIFASIFLFAAVKLHEKTLTKRLS
ncbi:MAG: ABC transporter permease [Candidatus Bathyarchaeota archaeon]|nr:ABC transporter permease [Candidatus Bathyarchaeota archaeon]